MTRLIPLRASQCEHGAITVECPKCKTRQLLSQDEDDWFDLLGRNMRIYPAFVCRGRCAGGRLCQHAGPAKLVKVHKGWMQ